jgi:hypothetical protein
MEMAARATVERDELLAAIRGYRNAKNRYHTQLACERLLKFLPDNVRPLAPTDTQTPTQNGTTAPTKPLMAGCQQGPCSVSFGYQWMTLSGKRAFCWTVSQGCRGMILEGITYDEERGVWDGESSCDLALALSRPATGRVPNQPQLRERLQRAIADMIDYTVRPSGTM